MLWWLVMVPPVLGWVWLWGSVELAVAAALIPYGAFVAIDDR